MPPHGERVRRLVRRSATEHRVEHRVVHPDGLLRAGEGTGDHVGVVGAGGASRLARADRVLRGRGHDAAVSFRSG